MYIKGTREKNDTKINIKKKRIENKNTDLKLL